MSFSVERLHTALTSENQWSSLISLMLDFNSTTYVRMYEIPTIKLKF